MTSFKTSLDSEMKNSKDGNGDYEGLDATILADYNFHKNMLDLVPPQFYFGSHSKKIKSMKEDVEEPYEDESESDDENTRKKTGFMKKVKRMKYDPSQIKTTTQLQADMVELERVKRKSEQVPKSDPKSKRRKSMKCQKTVEEESSLKSTTESLEDLREKLQAKINTLKAKRNALGKSEDIEKKRMKRKMSKMKLKMRRKLAKQNQVKDDMGPTNGASTSKNTNIKSPSRKPIYNKEGKMVFSKFDFSDSGSSEKINRQEIPTGKNYSKLLEKVQRQKEKIEKLKEADSTTAHSLQEKTAWQTALHKAEGVKVKDNVDMLKKAVKRKEKLRKKSSKEWDVRKEKLQEKMKGRQDKRHKNLKTRKQQKIKKKIDKAKKKGRIVPGF